MLLPWSRSSSTSGQHASPQDEQAMSASPADMTSGDLATSTSSKPQAVQPSSAKGQVRPPWFIGLGSSVFLVAFTGAAIYGFRAGRKAELREAAEAAKTASSSPKAPAQAAPTALSSTRTSTVASAGHGPSAQATSSGGAAPSVLSRSGTGAASRQKYSVPLRNGGQGGSVAYQEPPAVIAVKAFTIATALVGVASVTIIEVGRRVLGIEDVYDLTDRLHAAAPKSFAFAERFGSFLRSKLEGLFPQSEEDRADPLLDGEVLATGSAALSTAVEPKSMEEAYDEIDRASTFKEKLHLLDVQLNREKAADEEEREHVRQSRPSAQGKNLASE